MAELAKMVEAANSLSAEFGISVAEATAQLTQATRALAALREPDTNTLLRIAYMAAQLLPAMRDAGIEDSHPAAFTALRDALMRLQMESDINPLGDDEVIRDLMELASDLEQPKT